MSEIHLDWRNKILEPLPEIDEEKIKNLARFVRGFMFTAIDAAQSGHPGGSSSKVENLLSLICGGVFAFDPLEPKNRGRDRLIWSAGHCSPLLYGTLALIYESLKKVGQNFAPEKIKAVMAKDLLHFRHIDGPQGHVESYYPLCDLSTGSSGHALSGAAGMATVHQSSGLKTKFFVLMGDAETEEGMSYEARNIIRTLGLKNLIVTLDYNHFGIDGNINEVISSPYVNHWLGLGWNVIEVDAHNPLALVYAFRQAGKGFDNKSPTIILTHGIKGKDYGNKENTSDSHGTPATHEEYCAIMQKLGFNITGETKKDLEILVEALPKEDVQYLVERLNVAKKLLKPEKELVAQIKKTLTGRPLVNPTVLKRPSELPGELIFEQGTKVPTRKATEAWFKWLMKKTAFFYIGAGDLMKSILTGAAEKVYGLINRDNPLGRGIRFGIAEQNMAMLSTAMTQDILPGGFQAISAFASYAAFSVMMANAVRMTLIGNHVNPVNKGFFIMLCAHDGPETGEDGPTHHGLFWMSLFTAYPGIKVYKPLDANEVIEMLFYALERGEPIALSVARPPTPVFKRGGDIPPAREAINGAYVFKPYRENGKKKIVLVVCGGQTMANTLEAVSELEAQDLDIKIIAVTSPELYAELCQKNPQKAQSILAPEERQRAITLHNGWPGFLYPFLLPEDYPKKSLGINHFLKSGPPAEMYQLAKLTPADIKEKILSISVQD